MLPSKSSKQKRETIFVVAKPDEDEDDQGDGEDEWEGTLKRLTRLVERQARQTKEELSLKADKIQSTIEECAKKELV